MKLKHLSILTALLLSSLLLFAKDYQYNEKNGIRIFHQGSMFVKEGVPFLSVKGDSYEMGLQYGVLMNDQIMKMQVKVDSVVETYVGKFFLKKWIANMVLKSKIRKIEKRMPEEFIKELEGIAEGCELNLREVKTMAYFPQIFFEISCTSFVLKNENGIVHGRNLDWPGIEIFTKFPLIVNYHRKGKIPTTILTFVNYPGAYTGMNHNGLSMSINMNGCPIPEGKEESDYVTSMPMPFELRYVMENADELSEVDEMLNNYSTHGWFITVGSSKDQSGAMYELTRGECIKNRMQDNYVGVTNLAVSEKGRYEYSSINMHGESNITREDKLKELNQNISNNNLVDKAYQMVSSTAYYELPHDTSWGCSINNDITVKSCIMDNTRQKIYFAYGEMLAGCNQFLEYEIATQDVSVYREKQTIPDGDYLKNRLVFKKWYRENYSRKKKLEEEDYLKMIEKVNELELQPAYKYNLLSRCYINVENKEKAIEYASKYVAEMPTFGSAYITQFTINRLSKDYEKAIQSILEMLKNAHNTPSDYFWAKRQMIRMYDKMQTQSPNPENIRQMKKLNQEIKELCKPFYPVKWVKSEMEKIDAMIAKYQ
ncbi:C45 family peptidase [Marinifilum flexuosum]|uniref:Acyl-CoA:6-aminopenicillanic acid acyl transferase n=1 Tax=Marinifilum flexuosum TaxID=1117708 RepID=A0A419X3C0_9BACT|nr:C45 family peptidase [Marinifilum flexuosum]RKE02225.1 acyl-CoA:6-aminopenicillanic acid acyl transferase [Marinifilum flexuosum]